MTTETRTLIDAAVEKLPSAKFETIDAYDHLGIATRHPSSTVDLVDLERFADQPRRIRQTVRFEAAKDFCAYVKAFDAGDARVFASLADLMVRSSIDYHDPAATPGTAASWRTHNATYPAVFAAAFAAWHAVHGKPMSQRTFAEFLEDRAEDAVSGQVGFPEPADLMEVAQSFDVNRSVKFVSALNVSTNERKFRFEESDKPAGAIGCPKVIRLFTPVFQGSDPVHWGARLSYDISDGKLQFTVKIHRLQELLEAEFTRLCDAIAVDLPGVPIHRGKTTSGNATD